MLLHGAGANAQLAGDFLITASLDQQVEHLLISWRDLNSIEIHHEVPSPSIPIGLIVLTIFAIAPVSPNFRFSPTSRLVQSLLTLRDEDLSSPKRIWDSPPFRPFQIGN